MTITLATGAAGAVAGALTMYVLFGGADFGGGVWDALARGPRRDAQRSLIAHAIGPIWEANHVWLVVAVVILFTCFPAAFALLATTLHIPLSLALIGIVMRAPLSRFARTTNTPAEERWARIFSMASIVTPFV